MDFLRGYPSVCVVGSEYQIVGGIKELGTVAVEVGGEYYYEDNSGVLPCTKHNYKISVPCSVLDKAKKYTIIYKKVIEKKKYFSVVEKEVELKFKFKPLEKQDNINIIHLADVHKRFALAKEAGKYFGNDVDLFVINGDIAEVDTDEDYLEVLDFIGEVGKGEIPMIFARGNHDTRGKLAEKFTDYFPSEGFRTYFSFEIGCIGGLVVDVGEDKSDSHEVYAGLNLFEGYRRKQTAFLKSIRKTDKKYFFAVSHIPFCTTTVHKGDEFDIERDTYTVWGEELKRIGTGFMLSGHLHRAFVLDEGDESKTCPCEFPVIVGSALFRPEEIFWGTAITLTSNFALVKFIDDKKQVVQSFKIDLLDGKVIEE